MKALLSYVGASGNYEWPAGNGPTCVDLLLHGVGLDEFRRTRDLFEKTESGANWRPAFDYWQNPYFDTQGRQLDLSDSTLVRRLASAAQGIFDRPPRQVGAQRMLPEAVPAPLKPAISPAANSKECGSFVSLSAPSISGDFAFVDLAYACGSLCGEGQLVALERRDDRWVVVAATSTFTV